MDGWYCVPWSAGAWLSEAVWTHPGVNRPHFVTEFDPLISSNLRITASKENHQDQLELVPMLDRVIHSQLREVEMNLEGCI